MGKTQLNFLRLLSEKATQMINITCTGSQGCFDRNSNIVEKAIKLQGANDGVLSFMKDDDSSIKITQVILKSHFYCAFHKRANSEVQKPTDDCVFHWRQSS